MKFKLTMIGILTLAMGVIPLLDHFGVFASPFPTTGWIYSVIIITIGVIDFLYSNLATLDLPFGSEHLISSGIAVLTIGAGILPLLSKLDLPAFLPTTGPAYYAIVCVVGLIGTIYGISLWKYG